MDNLQNVFFLLVFYFGMEVFSSILKSHLLNNQPINRKAVFLSCIIIAILLLTHKWNEIATIGLTISYVGCKILWQQRKKIESIAILLMGLSFVFLIYSDGGIVSILCFICIFIVFGIVNFDNVIDFVYNNFIRIEN